MKLLLFALTLTTISFSSITFSQKDNGIDTSEDETKVKEAVVKWADATFYSHTEYRFENFYVFWSEDYEISLMRSDAYKEMLNDLEKDKAAGKYNGTDEAYEKEHSELQEKYNGILADANSSTNRVDYYQISFWSNIQTNDGITVYYEHIVKLNGNFEVTEAVINSAIGTKSDKTEIVYKEGATKSTEKKK